MLRSLFVGMLGVLLLITGCKHSNWCRHVSEHPIEHAAHRLERWVGNHPLVYEVPITIAVVTIAAVALAHGDIDLSGD